MTDCIIIIIIISPCIMSNLITKKNIALRGIFPGLLSDFSPEKGSRWSVAVNNKSLGFA